MLPPKSRPRYLPTLTQVVTPSEVESVEPTSLATPKTLNHDAQMLAVQELSRALMPEVSARLRQMMQEVLDERLHQMEAEMRQEVEAMVRRAISGCEI